MEDLLTRIEQRLETLAGTLFPDQMPFFNAVEEAVNELIENDRDQERGM